MTIEDETFNFPDKETFICDECGEMHYVDEGHSMSSEGMICAHCKPPLYDVEEEQTEEREEGEEEALSPVRRKRQNQSNDVAMEGETFGPG